MSTFITGSLIGLLSKLPIGIIEDFSKLVLRPLISAKLIRIFLTFFTHSEERSVNTEVSSAKPSALSVSRADSFIKRAFAGSKKCLIGNGMDGPNKCG